MKKAMRMHKADVFIGLIVAGLMTAGLVIIYAIGPRVAQAESGSAGDMSYFWHYAIFVGLAFAALVAGYFLPFEQQQKWARAILWLGVILCVAVTILGKMGSSLVYCNLGACRAFSVGFQPAELLKLGILFYTAGLITERKKQKKLEGQEFWIPIATMFVMTGVLIGWWQKDLGSTVVIFAMLTAMLFMAGVRGRYLAAVLLVMAAAAVILVMSSEHRARRLASFSGDGDTYHIDNSLLGMGAGGLFGVGLGNSVQSTGYLPEALSDSIFSVIGEMWGFAGAILILALYLMLFLRMIKVAHKTQEEERSLFTIGVFAWILAHVILNVGGMTGLLPMKGITLPFLSYGGSSMLVLGFAVGDVLQLSRMTQREEINEDTSSGGRQRRTRYASSRRS
ncbi:FtsW/RodA/SpoVE family cell cycle protein [Candidatus Saccharibacteria bacterium]|nr:FtsW/RodA/SpoVE family cell cycle protein [Candidatus Saccharibacteria bacterium]